VQADVTPAATARVSLRRLRSNRIRGCRSSLGFHAACHNLRFGDKVHQFRHFDLELDEPSVPIEAGQGSQKKQQMQNLFRAQHLSQQNFKNFSKTHLENASRIFLQFFSTTFLFTIRFVTIVCFKCSFSNIRMYLFVVNFECRYRE